MKRKSTEFPGCGEGEGSPRVLTSRSAGMGVGALGRAKLAEAQEGLTRREGKGSEKKRGEKKKKHGEESAPHYGC